MDVPLDPAEYASVPSKKSSDSKEESPPSPLQISPGMGISTSVARRLGDKDEEPRSQQRSL